MGLAPLVALLGLFGSSTPEPAWTYQKTVDEFDGKTVRFVQIGPTKDMAGLRVELERYSLSPRFQLLRPETYSCDDRGSVDISWIVAGADGKTLERRDDISWSLQSGKKAYESSYQDELLVALNLSDAKEARFAFENDCGDRVVWKLPVTGLTPALAKLEASMNVQWTYGELRRDDGTISHGLVSTSSDDKRATVSIVQDEGKAPSIVLTFHKPSFACPETKAPGVLLTDWVVVDEDDEERNRASEHKWELIAGEWGVVLQSGLETEQGNSLLLAMGASGAEEIRFTIADGCEIGATFSAPLGESYQREMEKFVKATAR